MMISDLTIIEPDDGHIHFRDWIMMISVLEHSAEVFRRGVIMPNRPKILTPAQMVKYKREIELGLAFVSHAKGKQLDFQPLMTFYGTEDGTPEEVAEFLDLGAIGEKFYPIDMTTGSDSGIENYNKLHPQLEALERYAKEHPDRRPKPTAFFHGTHPRVYHADAPGRFLPIFRGFVKGYPGLNFKLEHLSTGDQVEEIRMLPANATGTIAPQYLIYNHDDVMGALLHPHRFCLPHYGRPEDQLELIDAAIDWRECRKFSLGTDTAPQNKRAEDAYGKIFGKECAVCCGGTFSAIPAMGIITTVFERARALGRVQAFTSENFAISVGLPFNQGKIRMVRSPRKVPNLIDGIVPLLAGETQEWRAERI